MGGIARYLTRWVQFLLLIVLLLGCHRAATTEETQSRMTNAPPLIREQATNILTNKPESTSYPAPMQTVSPELPGTSKTDMSLVQGYGDFPLVLDMMTMQLKTVWPSEADLPPFSYGTGLASMPDGSLRALLAYGEQRVWGRMLGWTPIVLLGNPETGEVELIWKGEKHSETSGLSTYYFFPEEITFSFSSEEEFVFILGGNLWLANTSGEERSIGAFGSQVIAWRPEGIVILDEYQGRLRLVDENGRVRGEIVFKD